MTTVYFRELSQGSSVSLQTKLDDQDSIPGRGNDGMGPYTASYPMGTGGSFPGGKAMCIVPK